MIAGAFEHAEDAGTGIDAVVGTQRFSAAAAEWKKNYRFEKEFDATVAVRRRWLVDSREGSVGEQRQKDREWCCVWTERAGVEHE